MRILALRLLPSHEFIRALRALSQAHPDFEVTALLMTGAGRDEVQAELQGHCLEVMAGGLAHRWQLWRRLRRRGFDRVLVFTRAQARPWPRAWPACALALLVPAAERRLVSGGKARRLDWVYIFEELALFPAVSMGAFVLWLAPLALVAVVLGADLVRKISGSGRLR